MNPRRSSRVFSLHCVFKDFLHQEISVIISPCDPIQGRVARADLDWSAAGLAPAASVAVTVNRFKASRDSRPSKVEKLRSAMEATGLVFIPKTGGRVGVRLREPEVKKKTKSLKSQEATELSGWRLGTRAVLCRVAAAIQSRELARWRFDAASPRSFFEIGISAAFSALTIEWPSEPPRKPRRSGRCLDVISKFIEFLQTQIHDSIPFGTPLTRFGDATVHTT
jgi:hypothetical protein